MVEWAKLSRERVCGFKQRLEKQGGGLLSMPDDPFHVFQSQDLSFYSRAFSPLLTLIWLGREPPFTSGNVTQSQASQDISPQSKGM